MYCFQSVHTVAMVTTVRTSATVPASRATRRLENACVELERLETTVVSVSIFTSLLRFSHSCNDSVSFTAVKT